MSMLIRNHLLCPHPDCEAHDRRKTTRIEARIDEKRNVTLTRSEKRPPQKSKMKPEHKKWESPNHCPFCHRPVTVVIDETHNGRNIYLRT